MELRVFVLFVVRPNCRFLFPTQIGIHLFDEDPECCRETVGSKRANGNSLQEQVFSSTGVEDDSSVEKWIVQVQSGV